MCHELLFYCFQVFLFSLTFDPGYNVSSCTLQRYTIMRGPFSYMNLCFTLFCLTQSYVSNPYWLQIYYVGEVVLELLIFLSLFSMCWDCRHVPWHLVKLHKSGCQFYYQYLQDFSALTIIISNFCCCLVVCLVFEMRCGSVIYVGLKLCVQFRIISNL